MIPSTYQVVNFMADATFYFLPILLANSAAPKSWAANPYLAMMLGGILIHPNFVSMVSASQESGVAITIFGLPIYNATYSSSVIPHPCWACLLMSKVEPVATRISLQGHPLLHRAPHHHVRGGHRYPVRAGPHRLHHLQHPGFCHQRPEHHRPPGWLPTIIGALLPFWS